MEVFFLGYKKPTFQLDSNIHFISLAEKRAPSPKAWSNKLIDYFKSINDPYFHFSLEDYLIIRPVDLELITICEEMMNDNIGRIDCWNSFQYSFRAQKWISPYKTYKGVNFLKMSQQASPWSYRISSSNAIWNRTWFLKTLERNFSTYDWETKPNDGRHNGDGFEVLATKDRWTPSVVHSLSNKWWGNNINIESMLDVDLTVLKQLSETTDLCHHFIEDRGRKSIRSVYNVKEYIVSIERQRIDFWKRRLIQKIQSFLDIIKSIWGGHRV